MKPETGNSGQRYTKKEEITNAFTHGLGLIASIAGLILLIQTGRQHGDRWHLYSFVIFGFSLILLYASSTLYHSLSNQSHKRTMRIIDHSAIFLLIAGTYTPFLLTCLRGTWGWSLFGVIWGLAFFGIIFKVLFKSAYPKLSLAIYLMMGWLCVFAAHEMYKSVPITNLVLLAIGGVCYTAGVIFYRWHSLPYHHAIWHLLVLAGSTFHFFAILSITCSA